MGMSLAFERLINFRDVGGARTADGRVFKTGVLFRSAALSRMTAQDAAKLDGLGIKLICDLRSPEESKKRPPRGSRIRVVNISLHDPQVQDHSRLEMLRFLLDDDDGKRFREFIHEYYRHIAFDRTSEVREIVSLLAGDDALPALIQCSAGKDRTGLISAIIQLLVDVPYEKVQSDYVLTNDSYAPQVRKLVRLVRILTLGRVPAERVRLLVGAHAELLDEVHRAIMTQHGSVETYLRAACGIDPRTLEMLKTRLLAPA